MVTMQSQNNRCVERRKQVTLDLITTRQVLGALGCLLALRVRL